ncbi:hypothetical protein DFH08DRAFT_1040456 [Mycena albidolilacea]|uniref:Uncharacterized protein n=1 Tax=Mycena albidolilacea TaxID=1033008 RepID=A0AAD7EE20_9AGAR|nr:hypothetical protein DFH08DRAFT_1040456 [Mycena albidolilacea]
MCNAGGNYSAQNDSTSRLRLVVPTWYRVSIPSTHVKNLMGRSCVVENGSNRDMGDCSSESSICPDADDFFSDRFVERVDRYRTVTLVGNHRKRNGAWLRDWWRWRQRRHLNMASKPDPDWRYWSDRRGMHELLVDEMVPSRVGCNTERLRAVWEPAHSFVDGLLGTKEWLRGVAKPRAQQPNLESKDLKFDDRKETATIHGSWLLLSETQTESLSKGQIAGKWGSERRVGWAGEEGGDNKAD